MKPRHTPGPWEVNNFGTEIQVWSSLGPVALMLGFNRKQLANARLIAMTPTLLEVAKNSRELFHGLLPLFEKLDELSSTGCEPGLRQIIDTIDLVLKHTEGK